MPRTPPPVPRPAGVVPPDAQVGDLGDMLEDAETWIANNKDTLANIAEVAVTAIAPASAPIVAAEHALRTGAELSNKDAKKATTAATALGNAVADHVEAKATGSSRPVADAVIPDDAPAAQAKKGKAPASSSSSALPILFGLGLLFFLLD